MECAAFQSGVCRSCEHLDRTLSESIEQKRDAVARIFPDVDIADFVSSESVGSRIRARFAVAGTESEPRLGFFSDSRELVPLDQCPLHHPLINDWIAGASWLIREARLVPYDPHSNRGELKFIVVTCSPTHEQLMVQFVLRSREAVDRIRSLWSRKPEFWRSVSVVSINVQPTRSSLINGPDEIAVSDATRLPIAYSGLELFYGPQSFVQTNHRIAEQLYATVASRLIKYSGSRVLDLYCGAGAFAIHAAQAGCRTLGVDVSQDAILGAAEAARRNELPHASFQCRSLLHTTALMAEFRDSHDSFDAIICNPPRRGLDAGSRELIAALQPRTLIYSSCNPPTLARDVESLSPHFRVEELLPFDMFPFTRHCEVVAVMRIGV